MINSFTKFISLSVPPDILDYPTSTDMVAREGSNVTMKCAAKGTPEPKIIWKREGGEAIPIGQGQEGKFSSLFLLFFKKLHSDTSSVILFFT